MSEEIVVTLPTAEAIRKQAENCPDAGRVLHALFPAVFAEKEEKHRPGSIVTMGEGRRKFVVLSNTGVAGLESIKDEAVRLGLNGERKLVLIRMDEEASFTSYKDDGRGSVWVLFPYELDRE